MTSPFDADNNGWFTPPAAWQHLPDMTQTLEMEAIFHKALREAIHQLAQSKTLRQNQVFCFLKAPIGGKAIAFAC